MEGQLWKTPVSATIETECAHCKQPMRLEIDSALRVKWVEPGAEPQIFVPLIDFKTLKDPSITDKF